MQPTPNSNDLAQVMRFIQTPMGQQLLAALQESNSEALRSAMADAASGDFDRAKASVSAFLATPEAKRLLSQLEGGK